MGVVEYVILSVCAAIFVIGTVVTYPFCAAYRSQKNKSKNQSQNTREASKAPQRLIKLFRNEQKGIIGNGLTLWVLLKTGKWRKNTTNLLIWSLSIADFSVVLFMVPLQAFIFTTNS